MPLLRVLLLLAFFTQLQADTVLITGANRGLGLEFARQYRSLGYEVIGTARRPEAATELRASGARVEPLDVTDPASITQLASRLSSASIDILINNAGVIGSRSAQIPELDFDAMQQVFAVNTLGPMRVLQALLPMLKRGKQKRVINISSRLGSIASNSGALYAYRASKAALNQLMRTSSVELEAEGFTILLMHPGWVRTRMGGSQATYSPEESVRRMIAQIQRLDHSANGRYLDLNGNSIPW